MNTKRLVRWVEILLISALLMPTAVLFVLYTPLTQNIVAQWATAWLTKQTGMEIKVEQVSLQFPLRIEVRDLRIGTLLSTEGLDANIRLRPLMRGVIKIDYISAKNIAIHTDTLNNISTERLRADDISYNLNERKAHIRRVLLDEGNAVLYSSASPQPRVTRFNRLPLSLTIADIQLLHIAASYTNTQMEISSWTDRIALHDIAVDTVLQVSLQSIEMTDGAVTLRANGTEPWVMTELTACADSLRYTPTYISGQLTHLAFKESHGINLQEGYMNITWKNGQLSLPKFALHTDNSTIQGHLHALDYKAKDMFIDGDAEIHIGYNDARFLARWLGNTPQKYVYLYPSETFSASIDLQGTMEQLLLNRVHISLPTVFDINVNGIVQHIASPRKCAVQCHLEARSYDLDFLTTIMEDSTLHIPSNLTYRGDILYSPDTLHAQCLLTLSRGTATIEANYASTSRTYELHLQTDSLDLRQIIPNEKLGIANLQAYVTGNSTDYLHEDSFLRGALQLHTLQWGEHTFTNVSAQIAVTNKRLRAYASCYDTLMRWSIATSAKYAVGAIEATSHLQINHLDMHALHLTNTDIYPTLRCRTTLRIDSGEVYSLHTHLTDIALITSTQHIQPRPLSLQATLTPDTALLAIHSGDLTLKASAHTNGLPWQWEQVTSPLRHLEQLQATLLAGDDNPISNYLALTGIKADGISLTANYTNDILHTNLHCGMLTWSTPQMTLQGKIHASLLWAGAFALDSLSGTLHLTDAQYTLPAYNLQVHTEGSLSIPFERGGLMLTDLPLYTNGKQPLLLNGKISLFGSSPTVHLRFTTSGANLLQPQASPRSLLYGKAIVSSDITLDGPFNALSIAGNLQLRPNSSIHYIYKDAILTASNQLDKVVTFVSFSTDTTVIPQTKRRAISNNLIVNLNISIAPTAQLDISLGANQQNSISLQGEGTLTLQYIPATGLRLSGKYTIEAGNMKMNVPLLHVSNMTIRQGSTVTWSGNPLNPLLNISAEERIRASVTLDGSPQSVLFIAGVSIYDTLEKLNVQFTLSAPENASMQNTLATLSPEERGKLSVALLTTGLYLGEGGTGNLMNTALMGILQSQLDNISRDAFRTVDVSVGIEPLPDGVSGVSTRTDYSFSIAKRLWNNRIRIIIGGSVTTNNERIEEDAVIDNISIEWRINPFGNQYLRFFYDKNYESILEGEIRETGVGYAYKRSF